jgi:hypothetical protein
MEKYKGLYVPDIGKPVTNQQRQSKKCSEATCKRLNDCIFCIFTTQNLDKFLQWEEEQGD